jgi:glycosyltransferase involved in cell wall biosynthesis
MDDSSHPLRICLLSYRSNPHCGGQGVYLKNLSRALADLGHHVSVLSGPPDPELDADIPVTHLPCLDLYNPEDPFRIPTLAELCRPVNLLEWVGVSTMGFPEPYTFGIRAYQHLRNRLPQFDIVHDNQSLSYGVWALSRRIPTVATIHHPVTVDRLIAIRSVRATWKKLKQWRWYGFVGMQKSVARMLPRIVTVSKSARNDIGRDFNIPGHRFDIVPNGINTELFYPLNGVPRQPGRIIVTNSADTPLKGLYYLLKAIALVSQNRAVHLVVVGTPKENGGIVNLIRTLGIGRRVTFTGRISYDQFVREYAQASIAVVPSVYEGFGLPAGEAMACAVPVISTTGGALPEVVGDTGVLVPPADPDALAAAIVRLIDNPELASRIGWAGYRRIQQQFTWLCAARRICDTYRRVIRDYGRF